MPTVELDDELYERLERHTDDSETVTDLIADLVGHYEAEGTFLQEGYSE